MMIKGNIRNRLYNQEAPPPPDAWDAIALALDETEERQTAAPVIPITRNRGARWMRIALAASVLGFVAMTALWLRDRNAGNTSTAGTGTTASGAQPPVQKAEGKPGIPGNKDSVPVPITVPPGNTQNDQLAGNEDRSNPPAVQPARQPVNIPIPPRRNNNQQLAGNQPQPVNNNRSLQPYNNNNNPVANNNVALAQVQMKDSSGKVIKSGIGYVGATDPANVTGPVSRGDQSIGRILNRISQQGDREELDSIIQNSPYWKAKIQEWRNILIKSGYTPTIINFMDFAELQKLLQEQKRP